MSTIIPLKPTTLNVAHKVTLSAESPVLVRAYARKRPTPVADWRTERIAEASRAFTRARTAYQNAYINGYALGDLRSAAKRLARLTGIDATVIAPEAF